MAASPAARSAVHVGSTNGTRNAPRLDRPGAQKQSTGAEAPRPARDRIDGRSPGSRVVARHRLPGFSQWLCGTGSPLTVAGAAVDLEPQFRTTFPVRSRTRDRRPDHLMAAVRALSMHTGVWIIRALRAVFCPL